jgi:hypothetical protein
VTERDPTPPTFVRGNDIIDRLAADPFIADDIAPLALTSRRWTGSTR